MIISSERLDLISMSPDFLRASLRREIAAAERLLSARIPSEWPDIPQVLKLRLCQLDAHPTLAPWLLRAMVERNTGTMVGHIGFHTAPGAGYLEPYSPGAVEFGFGVMTAYRRRGYAREASIAMMRWAREAYEVRNFVLTISPDNLPSQALAAQLGFVRIGSHIDEEDGLEDILELRF